MKTTTATLEQLRPGHEYPGTSVNSRTAYRDTDIEQIAASLLPANDGQLKPLLCCTHPSKPGVFFVFDGNRRRSGFGLALSRKQIEKSHPIEIKDFGEISPEEALRKSWAANEQVPLHPADRYAVFAQINAQGAAPAEIAEKFGMTTRAVEQSLAFGAKLDTSVLDAWRCGQINADLAKIFTLGEKDEQKQQLDKLKDEHKRWQGRSDDGAPISEMYQVEDKLRKALAGNQADAERYLKFVGRDAYLEAGGRISQDLFGEEETDIVQDLAKLKKLAKEKLQKRADKLLEEGWSWAEVTLSAHTPTWNYDKSSDKKKAGCIVSIKGTKIEVESGLKKRDARTASSAPAQASARKEPERDIDGATERALGEAQDAAAATAIEGDSHLALAALLASAAIGGWDMPVDIEFRTVDGPIKLSDAKTWRQALEQMRKLPTDALLRMLGTVVGACINTTSGLDKDSDALLAALDQKVYAAELAKNFDAKVYFKGASKKHILDVINEALGPEERRRNEAKSRDALAKFAMASVTTTDWLPEQLRTAAYVGPKPAKTYDGSGLTQEERRARDMKPEKPKRKKAA